MRRGDRRRHRRRQHPRPVRPPRGPRARRDPVAARRGVGPPPPRAHGRAPARGPRPRVRRAPRGAPRRDAHRLRRQRGQPLRPARLRRRAHRRGPRARRRRRRHRRAQRRQGARQGPAQDDLQDGDLHDPVLLRGADLRGRRAGARPRRAPLHGHRLADRRHRPRGPGRGGARAPRPGLAGRRAGGPPARRRHLRLAARRRAPHVEPGDDRAAAARGQIAERQRPAEVRGVLAPGQRGRRPPGDPARPARLPRGPRADRPRRGRAGRVDRQAVRDRRDVARVDLDARRTRRWRSR